jgi:hypothetical protein
MTRYRLIGAPYGSDRPLVEQALGQNLESVTTGLEFDADLTDEQEQSLMGAGAIETVDKKEKESTDAPTPEPASEPQAESAPEPPPASAARSGRAKHGE